MLFFDMHIEKSVGPARARKPALFVAPATGEVFEGKDDRYQYLQGWRLFEGFGVVQGRVWKDGTACWGVQV
jgi:hypothetical protein